MAIIIDFLTYKAFGETITYLYDEEADCERPFHNIINVKKFGDHVYCVECEVKVEWCHHPSFDEPRWFDGEA